MKTKQKRFVIPHRKNVIDEVFDTETGEPAGYYVRGNTIGILPIPDGIYTIYLDYRQEFRPLTSGTNVPFLSDLGVDDAIMYTCYMLKLKDEEYNSADRFKGEYEDALKAAMSP